MAFELKKIREELRHGPAIQSAPRVRRIWPKVALVLVLLLVLLPIGTLAGLRVLAALRETKQAKDLAPASGRFLATRGGRMFLQEKGPRDGPPVVLIHGTGAWSELWRPTIDRLASDGFRVVALDMPPFGFSDRPHPPRYTRADQAQRIADVLDGLGISGAYLVGHSFGAGPTVETVLRFPDKVRGLVLVAGALGLTGREGSGDPPAAVAWLLEQDTLRNTMVAATATNPLLTRQLLSMMIYRKEKADGHAVQVLRRPMPLARSTQDLGEWLKYFLGADSAALSANRSKYEDIKVPTSLVWGDKDSLTPLAQGLDLRELIKGSSLVVLPEVGHIPQVEDPGAFNNHLSDVLRRMAAK